MDSFVNRVLKTIRRESLIPAGAEIYVGFSGGADSVCLLHVLKSVERLLKCSVRAVHVNHNLRDGEAARDQAFCEKFCAEHKIPAKSVSVDVAALIEERGLSTEEAARMLRYDALMKKAGGEGSLIAVAHHADDQAETILLNMIRGTGTKGFSGMSYRRGNIIRPLLDVGRDDILAYVGANGLKYVTDSTNLENDYARNRLRNAVLPELKKINQKASEHIVSAGEKIGEADEYIRELAAEYVRENVRKEESEGLIVIRIPSRNLKRKRRIFRIYVIIEALVFSGVPLKDWSEANFDDIDKLVLSGSGAHADLPLRVSADNQKGETVLKITR